MVLRKPTETTLPIDVDIYTRSAEKRMKIQQTNRLASNTFANTTDGLLHPSVMNDFLV